MIKTKMGETKLEGNLITLKCDISSIIEAARKTFSQNMSQEEADDHVREAIQNGFMSAKEIADKSNKIISEFPEELRDVIGEFAIFLEKGMFEEEGKEDEYEN